MKRDMDLIRKLVLALEATDGYAGPLAIEGYTPEQIGHHAYLMVEAGLARGGEDGCTESGLPVYDLSYLTWAGHDFADAARDDRFWNSAMQTVRDKAGTVTFNVLTQLLSSLAKAALGMP